MAYWHSGILALHIGNSASYILGRKSSSVDTDNLTRCWQRRERFQLSPLLIQYKPLHMFEANITFIYLSAPSASPSMLSPHTPTLTTFDRCPLHNTNNIIHHIPYLVPTPRLTFSLTFIFPLVSVSRVTATMMRRTMWLRPAAIS